MGDSGLRAATAAGRPFADTVGCDGRAATAVARPSACMGDCGAGLRAWATAVYSRTLPENSGCDAVNMAFLPDSHGFPASNLASNAKEMGKIKLFPTTEYSSKQPVERWDLHKNQHRRQLILLEPIVHDSTPLPINTPRFAEVRW